MIIIISMPRVSRAHLTLAVIAVVLLAVAAYTTTSNNTPSTPPPPPLAIQAPQDRIDLADSVVRAGDVVTSEGLPNNYYIGMNGKRYVFPTLQTYRTWYPDNATLKKLDRKKLEAIPLTGNVTYRPGMRVITFATDPTYYVVSHGGVLREASQSLLRSYYGNNWKERVDTLEEYYLPDYTIGAPIYSLSSYSPQAEYDLSKTVGHDKNLVANLPSQK